MTGDSTLDVRGDVPAGSPVNESHAALLDAARAIWPAPATIRATRAGEHARPSRELLVLPDARRPRLAAPADAPRVIAEALGRTSSDLTPLRHAARSAVRLGLRMPGAGAMLRRRARDRIAIDLPTDAGDTGGSESLETFLCDLLGEPVRLCFGVGNARANRKPVVQAITPAGRTRAFAKLGVTAVGRELVRGEAAALTAYWSIESEAERLTVPRVVYAGEWRGIELLVLTPVLPRRRANSAVAPWRRRPLPSAAMRTLATRLGTEHAELADSPFWERIRAVPELTEFADRLGDDHGAASLEFGAWHGDWTPWNMAWDGDRVLLWDFERYAVGVPLGLDAAHYRLQSTLRLAGEDRAATLIRAERLVQADEAPDPPLASRLYLAELARRWVLASAPEDGAPLRPRTRWLLARLAELTPAGRGAS